MSGSRPRAWRPILEGSLAQRASQAVEAIAADLSDPERLGSANHSLALGDAGLALLFGYLAEAFPSSGYDEISGRYLDRSIESVAARSVSASLYPGFTGVAWTIEHLSRRGETPEEDPNEAIDELLQPLLERTPWTGPVDLTGGLVGICVYLRERSPRPVAASCLASAVDRLQELSESSEAGIAWKVRAPFLTLATAQQCPHGYFDLGVAHGVPGVISTLACACAAGTNEAKARPLLDGALHWLWMQGVPDATLSTFPPAVARELAARSSRFAWCYGDPGIAAVLLDAARNLEEPELERKAIALGRQAATRPAQHSGVVDAALCHGAAGLGHIFNRMFQHSGDSAFEDAAQRWLTRALDLRRPGEGFGGYRAAENRPGGGIDWVDNPSLLTGAAGIALALLAATSAIEPAWDRVFLLSSRNSV